MVTINLRVSDDETECVVLSTQEEFHSVLEEFGARCLVDEQQGKTFYGFFNLEEGATYSFKVSRSGRRPPLPPQLSPTPTPQQQNDAALLLAGQMLQSLALQFRPRKAACRMWTGDPTVYNLKATSFDVFDKEVKKKYPYLGEEEKVSYYFFKNKRSVESRMYVSNDAELDDFFDLAGKPTIYIWPRGSPSLSTDSLPSQVEIHLSSTESLSESSESSSRGHLQTLFRNAVRERDDNKCVLSREVLRPKAGNLEAAHIFGVEASLADKRKAARVLNPYDTTNGMLLEKSLHVAFATYLWCMDESLKVHVSEDGKNNGLEKWEGKFVTLRVNDDTHTFPPRALLKARFALYEEKQKKRKEMKKTGR